MYSGWWESSLGEMQETERDLNLGWAESSLVLGDFLFSLLEFLDLDC